MTDSEAAPPRVFLKPEEIHVAEERTLIRTVLGSCISVCVWDRVSKIGGMNHFVLADDGAKEAGASPDRYAASATSNLLRQFKLRGSRPQDLVVKIVGGAASADQDGHGVSDVGRRNVEAAVALVRRFGLEIAARDTGGHHGRKVEFDTGTGVLRIQRVGRDPPAPEVVRVLVVDDSKTVRQLLVRLIEAEPDLKVVGEAEDPLVAMRLRKSVTADVMTLDLNMPNMDGVTYLQTSMPHDPMPTIIVTDYSEGTSGPVFRALELGAFDYVKKPSFSEVEATGVELRDKIRAAHGNRRRRLGAGQAPDGGGRPARAPLASRGSATSPSDWLIAIGASTGGTEAIKAILRELPADMPPIVIVQHIPEMFSRVFAENLDRVSSLRVKEAAHGERLMTGVAYIAPGGRHLRLRRSGQDLEAQLTDDPPENRFRPSVDYLFRSVAEAASHRRVLAILLTGMGSDGARGLKNLRAAGVPTIVQDEATSVVFGMPKAAIELGAALHVLPLDEIAATIGAIVRGDSRAASKRAS